MANSLINSSVVSYETLMILENQLVVSTKINRQYDDKFGVDGAKVGDSIQVRLPAKFLGRTGWVMDEEAYTENTVTVTLDYPLGIDTVFQTSELLLDIDNFSDRVLHPQVSRLATMVDLYVTQNLSTKLWNAVGTPGTNPNQLITYLTGQAYLNQNAAPQDDKRYVVINTMMNITAVDALKGLFQAAAQVARQYRTGLMGDDTAGYGWYNSENLYVFTTGAQGGVPLVDGALQTGTTLVTDGWTAAAAQRLNIGDRFTIEGVNGVNPANFQSWGRVKQFVCTAVGVSNGAGQMTIQFQPPLIGPGTAQQTVDALPADNAPITIIGNASTATTLGMAFHRDVATLVSADLPIPENVDWAGRASDDQIGLSVACIRDFIIKDRSFPTRLDLLVGFALLRGELGTVFYGG